MSAMLDMLEQQATHDAQIYRNGMDAGSSIQRKEDYLAMRAVFAAYDMAQHDRNARIPTLLMAAIENARRALKKP